MTEQQQSYLKPPREATEEEMAKVYRPMVSPEGLKKLMGSMEPLKNTEYGPIAEQSTQNKIDAPKLQRPNTVISSKLSTLPVALFTLAPVYYICGVPFDLMAEFHKTELGKDVETAAYNTAFDFMPDIPGWGNVVQATPTEQFKFVKQYVNECGFYRRTQEQVYAIYGTQLNVIDRKCGGMFSLTVFTPGTVDRWVRPLVDELGLVRFVNENKIISTNTRELLNAVKGQI